MTQRAERGLAQGIAKWIRDTHHGDPNDPASYLGVANQANCKIEFYDGEDERGRYPEDLHRRTIYVNRRAPATDQVRHIVYAVTFWMTDTIMRQASALKKTAKS